MEREIRKCLSCDADFVCRTPSQKTCSKSCATRLRHATGGSFAPPPRPIYDRWIAKVDKLSSECWVWTGSTNGHGYGQLSSERGQKPFAAHRLSWEFHRGSIPDGAHVLHHCDNPPCVNPDHLFLGDAAANAADKVNKGRARGGSMKGESHPSAKLTREQVAIIRSTDASARSLAADFGVSKTAVTYARKGRTWAD